jgi:hypothetical protein
MADEKREGGLPDLSSLRIEPRARNNAQRGKRRLMLPAAVLVALVLLLGTFFLTHLFSMLNFRILKALKG